MIPFIRARLLADAAVVAIVGNKIYAQLAPQQTALPYITISEVSGVPERCRGEQATERVRVQVNAIAETYPGCDKLYKAIRAALDGKEADGVVCFYDNRTDLPRDEGRAHGKAIDFQLITNN